MSNPYHPPQSKSQQIELPALPWHAKLAIAALLASGMLACWRLIQFLIYTKARFTGSMFTIYIEFLYPTLLFGAAYMLFRSSKQAHLPLLVAMLIFGSHTYRVFHFYTFPEWISPGLYESYATKISQYLSYLPGMAFDVMIGWVVLISVAWYCLSQRKEKK